MAARSTSSTTGSSPTAASEARPAARSSPTSRRRCRARAPTGAPTSSASARASASRRPRRAARATYARRSSVSPSIMSTSSPLYAQILGAGACVAGTAAATSPVGSSPTTAAARSRSTSRLPDPDFLYKLALPSASSCRPDSPLTIARRPLPGTGPYRVDGSRCNAHRLGLRPQPPLPRLRARRRRPTGSRTASSRPPTSRRGARSTAVEHGNGRRRHLARRSPAAARRRNSRPDMPSQLHADSLGETEYLFLNTRVPPFDRLAARRAVNQAVDRGTARRADRRPPPRHRPARSCRPASPATGPTARTAATLAGRHLDGPEPQRGAQRSSRLQDPRRARAGLGARGPCRRRATSRACCAGSATGPRRASSPGDTSRYYDAIGDPETRAQIGWAGWIRDYTSAADFSQPLFTCCRHLAGDPAATTNYSRSATRARPAGRGGRALQQRDPVAGQAAWARSRPARSSTAPPPSRSANDLAAHAPLPAHRRLPVQPGVGRAARPALGALTADRDRGRSASAGRITERRRNRTYPAVGYTTSPVLKTGWATGPVPLRR